MTGLAVLEGHWDRGWSDSVAPIFELLLSSQYVRADRYDYERCRTSEHLLEAVKRHSRRAEAIYIGMHGSKTGLKVAGRKELPILEIAKAIADSGEDATVRGLYLSACQTGSLDVACEIFETAKKLEWIAGYGATVDSIESTVIDMIFFSRWLWLGKASPKQRAKSAASRIGSDVAGLAAKKTVRYGVFVRDRRHGVVDLMASQ